MLRTKFNITFIPLWLENTMSRTGMNFSDALNKDKLLSILSKQDIVFYLMANRLFMEIYGNGPVADTGAVNGDLVLNSFNANQEIIQEFHIAHGSMLQKDLTSLSKEHEFLQHALGETIDIDLFKDKNFTFVVQLIDDTNLIVRFKLMDNEVPAYKILGNFYEQILRTLNYCYPFNELAKTTLFGKYCQFVVMGVSK